MNMEYVQPINKWIPHIRKALRSCNMKVDVSEIINKVYNRELLFTESINKDAFAIIEPCWIASGKLQIHIYIMGGKREGILQLEKFICDYGRSVNALKVTALTRKGFAAKNSWWRHNTEGWKNPCDWIEKEL